jgi:hypothetical protein
MHDRKLRQRCERLIEGLDIPVPFDAGELCGRVAASRGRPIHLHAATMPAGAPCGVLVATPGDDYIIYERGTSQMHQEHIIVHEVGHVVGGHTAAVLNLDTCRLLLPSLDPAIVSLVLARNHYTADQEREAEAFATLVLERAHRWRPPASEWAAAAGTAGIRDRIVLSLDHPTGR